MFNKEKHEFTEIKMKRVHDARFVNYENFFYCHVSADYPSPETGGEYRYCYYTKINDYRNTRDVSDLHCRDWDSLQ